MNELDRMRQWQGREVRVGLRDGTSWTGWLRVELLTERSLSVYVEGRNGKGATLYIDQIVEIVPTAQST